MSRNSEKPAPPRLRAILVDDEPPARTHLATRLKAHPEIKIVGEAGDVPSAFALVEAEKPDVIFLDIQLPRRSGFKLLPLLEKVDPQPAVVFVTAFDEYAIRAFEANALDYLTKPVSPERLAKTVARMRDRSHRVAISPSGGSANKIAEPQDTQTPTIGGREHLHEEDFVLLRDGSLSMLVKTREIRAIESQGDYTRILLAEDETILMKLTLSHWERQLPSELFCKASRSLLVNRKTVTKMVQKDPSSWELHFEGLKTPIILSNLESKRLREMLS
ncbi:MAG: LytR/AlgR family response regulator transcription factor [Chthoniobacterales bacterium]